MSQNVPPRPGTSHIDIDIDIDIDIYIYIYIDIDTDTDKVETGIETKIEIGKI